MSCCILCNSPVSIGILFSSYYKLMQHAEPLPYPIGGQQRGTMDSGKYEILSGHNRVYAAGQAGITSVPAVVKTDLSDEEAEVYVIETNLLPCGGKRFGKNHA